MRGVVKFWNDAKRFGFIIPDDGGEDLFFHANDVTYEDPPPNTNAIVEFDVGVGQNGKAAAEHVVVVQAGDPTAQAPAGGHRGGPRDNRRPSGDRPSKPPREPLWTAQRRTELADAATHALMDVIAGNPKNDPGQTIDAAGAILDAVLADSRG